MSRMARWPVRPAESFENVISSATAVLQRGVCCAAAEAARVGVTAMFLSGGLRHRAVVLNDEAAAAKASPRLVSRSGVPLIRATTFRLTLDPNRAQHQQLLAHAGAARLAFNHHLARVKANLDQRSAERSYGIAEADLTPSLSWSKVSFINEMNAWKDGRAADARVALDDDGHEVRGLAWRHEVSADVFECASVNAAQALANWSKSRNGQRAGKPAGFPRFKSRHKTAPAFRLRAKYTEGTTSPVRSTGPRSLRLPKLGVLRSTSTPAGWRGCWPAAGSTSTRRRCGTSAVAGRFA
jgi:hypothetical protein